MSDRELLHQLRPRDDRQRVLSRRQFMQFTAAGAAASASPACSLDRPKEILPYAGRSPDVTPGVSRFYATSMLIDGLATGLLARTREGRPLKIEGNPEHPASLGASSIFHQAAVLGLYDPDRASAPRQGGATVSWQAVEAMLRRPRTDSGAGLRIVLEPTSSPLVHAMLADVRRRYPALKLTFCAPLSTSHREDAALSCFGRRLSPRPDLSDADVIFALDDDFLSNPFDLRPAREFAARRHVTGRSADINRLYVVEAGLSTTGTMAQHRLARPSHRIAPLAAALAASVLGSDGLSAATSRALLTPLDAQERSWLQAAARDLLARPQGRSLILAGGRQPPEVHVLANVINARLGNLNHSLHFIPPPIPDLRGDQDLPALVEEMLAGKVETLLVFEANLAYSAPADLPWARALRGVPQSAYFGPYHDETARAARWFAPTSHVFESWGDGRAADGTLSIIQPLIRSLHGGRSTSELLGMLADQPPADDYRRLRANFGVQFGEHLELSLSEAEWVARVHPAAAASFKTALARGFVEDTAFAPVVVKDAPDPQAVAAAIDAILARPAADGLELNLLPSPTLHDGRFANLSWLLELPDPITKLTWDNAALLSPATARRLGIEQSRSASGHPVLELTYLGRQLNAPALVVPGHADESVSLWLGYGRRGEERLATGVGVNAYRLRVASSPDFGTGLRVTRLQATHTFALTQPEQSMHDRPLALVKTRTQYLADPHFAREQQGALPSLLPEYPQQGPQWAMTIDLSKCIGCNACMVACQAENNVMVVGKEQVSRGREMHWLRIDSYYVPGDEQHAAAMVHQPMLCQHCEKAPCEYVCPVNATVHSPDGLNEMIYNRCIGTRFCSNNCPYKVRRFNYFDWGERERANQGSVSLQRNPEVTVRERGVMEKCTYCVQRIRAVEIDARIEQRGIKPGEVVTACQQACPTRAIQFGSLTHRDTEMVKWRAEPRCYGALHEQGTRPRTLYLARIDDENPELA